MITYSHIMVRYGELSTKGKNKPTFIRILYENIKNSLKDFGNLSYEMRYDHIYVYLNNENYEPVINRLKDVSGIHSLSLVCRVDKDMEVDFKKSKICTSESSNNEFQDVQDLEPNNTDKNNTENIKPQTNIIDESVELTPKNVDQNSNPPIDLTDFDKTRDIFLKKQFIYALFCF